MSALRAAPRKPLLAVSAMVLIALAGHASADPLNLNNAELDRLTITEPPIVLPLVVGTRIVVSATGTETANMAAGNVPVLPVAIAPSDPATLLSAIAAAPVVVIPAR